jgi:hypothetical protein
MLVAWRTDEQPEEKPFTEHITGPELIVSNGELVAKRLPLAAGIPAQRTSQTFDGMENTPLIAREHVRASC